MPMKFRIKREELIKGLSRVQSVADRKSTMPILSNVLIETGEGGISMTATDLEIGIRGVYEAQVEKEGGLSLSARKLYEIARELPSEDVLVESTEQSWAVVTSGHATFKFTGLAKEEFPSLPEVEGADFLPVDRQVVRDIIKKTIFSAGDNDTRYVLNGIYLHMKPADAGMAAEVVGTDGHRLAVVETTLDTGGKSAAEASAIIPKKSATELKKLLDEDDGEFEMALAKNHVVFRLGSLYMVSRLIEGNYPNYRQVIPSDNDKTAVVNRHVLASSLRRVSLLSRERTNAVKFSFEPGKAVLSSQNPEMGEAMEELEMEFESGTVEVGFNARYLLDALGVMEADKVNLLLKDSLSPCVLSQEGEEGYRCVVMPLRV